MLQVAPSLRIEPTEYKSLAEKALQSCGMGPAVWLLVQLHQAHAITFYHLPSLSAGAGAGAGAGAVSNAPAKGSSADPTSVPPTAVKSSPQSPASAATGISKARVQADPGKEGQTWNSPGEGPLGEQPYSTIVLIGTSVDVAIIVVLSWAAQLVQLGVTSEMMQDDNMTFVLGQ